MKINIEMLKLGYVLYLYFIQCCVGQGRSCLQAVTFSGHSVEVERALHFCLQGPPLHLRPEGICPPAVSPEHSCGQSLSSCQCVCITLTSGLNPWATLGFWNSLILAWNNIRKKSSLTTVPLITEPSKNHFLVLTMWIHETLFVASSLQISALAMKKKV